MTRRRPGRRLFAFGLSFLFLVVVAGCGGTGKRGSERSTGREHVRAPSLAGVALPLSDAHPYRFDAGPLDGHPFVLADGSSEALDMRSELLSSARLFATDAAVQGGRGELPEVWITELGWGAASEAGGELASGVPLPSYAAQARYYRELVTLLRDDRDLGFVRALFWWNLIDDTTLTGSEEGFRYYGLLHEDFSPKPVARAFSALASRRR